MKALVISGPPAVGKSTISRVLPPVQSARSLIEVDELRTQADQQLATANGDLLDEPGEFLRDSAATKAAARLARPLLKCGVQVIFLDYLGGRYGDIYREELAGTAPVMIVRLDVDAASHRTRNRSRTPRRRYPASTLGFLRTSARSEGRPDFIFDTSDRQPHQTAQDLQELLA